MTPINFHKKEKPLTSLVGLGGGAAGMANAGSGGITYIDEVYKTYLYKGDGTATQTITTGLDIAGDGGLVWVKDRDGSHNNTLQDSLMSDNQYVVTSSANGSGSNTTRIKTITSTGFQVGDDADTGAAGYHYTSWNFKKTKGFFDVVEYTGNGAASQTLSHELGCVPGCFMLKSISVNGDWRVWHRSIEPNTTQYGITLNGTSATYGTIGDFGSTDPTATQFTVGGDKNTDGVTYRCYLFGGGSSPAATAKSVNCNDGESGLDIAASSSVSFGTGTFCVECWVYLVDSPGTGSPSYGRIFQQDGPTGNNNGNFQITVRPSDQTLYSHATDGLGIAGSIRLKNGQWHHIAVVRDSSNTVTQYVNGIPDGTATGISYNFSPNSGSPRMRIGYYDTIGSNNGVFKGKVSNLRVTVGEPVYTSPFRPSIEPLTTTSQVSSSSNVKLICCDNTSVTGSTLTPGTITAAGNIAASTDSPFFDKDGYKFGEEGDQDIIKCGSYMGNGGAIGTEVDLGWQPQFLLAKNTANVGSDGTWGMFDDMRGIATDNNDAVLFANSGAAEVGWQRLGLKSTGFKLTDSNPQINGSNNTILYIAIRGRDAFVSKPAEAGTDVFAMDVGSGSNAIPPGPFDSGFPVDFALMREPAASSQWYTTARLQRFGYVRTNDTNAEAQGNPSFSKASNVGWGQDAYGSNWMSWAWKRGAGFDVVTYKGTGVDRYISHSLNNTPEMMWFKKKNDAKNWYVYHNYLNGGSSPQNYSLRLNTDAAQDSDGNTVWNQTAPTATHFRINTDNGVNNNNDRYIAMLFASVDGISKCGRYTGNGSTTGPSVTTGFQPRLIIVKRGSDTGNWLIYDSLRGFGTDQMYLNSTSPQANSSDTFDVSATGFSLVDDSPAANGNGSEYIYYAHA